MEKKLTIDFLSHEKQSSDYDWANINIGDDRAGKARCKIDGKTLIIYSINHLISCLIQKVHIRVAINTESFLKSFKKGQATSLGN